MPEGEGLVLSAGQLNRALLARQHLLRRTTRPLPRVLQDVGGLQMQYAPSGYIGCWSRIADFPRDRLTRALQQRTVVQATSLRCTIHLLSAADHPVLTAGIQRFRKEWWRRATRGRTLPSIDHDAVAKMIEGWFAQGPLTRAAVLDRLAVEGVDRAQWEGLSLWLDLLRVPPQGTWERRRAHLFGLARDELPAGPPVTEAEGLELLVRRYLGGFGPATVADLSSWAGVPAAAFEPVLAQMTLRRFRSADSAALIDLPQLPIPDADVAAPVRFLPTWDATLLVHARRTQILPEEHRPAVFSTKRPQSVGTVLVDGHVAATWHLAEGAVVVEPFEGLSRAAAREVETEAGALTAFMS